MSLKFVFISTFYQLNVFMMIQMERLIVNIGQLMMLVIILIVGYIQFGPTVVQNSGGYKKGKITIKLHTINSQIVDNYVVYSTN